MPHLTNLREVFSRLEAPASILGSGARASAIAIIAVNPTARAIEALSMPLCHVANVPETGGRACPGQRYSKNFSVSAPLLADMLGRRRVARLPA